MDNSHRVVVVQGSRGHTVNQLLGEVWLAATERFRRHFPQFLGGISADPGAAAVRVCYRAVHADGEPTWTSLDKMVKRRRPASTARASKRAAHDSDSEDDSDESEVEVDERTDQLKEEPSALGEMRNVKLGDLRLDDRSEKVCGAARLHELLVEKRSNDQHDLGWPTQGRELRWRLSLARDDELDALDTSNRWFEARVINSRRNKVHVHYRGWASKWDEWIPRTSPRIAPLHAHVARWRGQLRAGSLVQVGLQVPGARHTKWRNASVLEVATRTDTTQTESKEEQELEDDDDLSTRLRVHVQVDNDNFWLPAQDDLLCQQSTHQLSKPLSERERRLLAHDETLPEDSSESGENEVIEIDDEDDESDDDPDEVLDDDGGSSPPSRPPTENRRTESRTLNLNDVVDRIRSHNEVEAPTEVPNPARGNRYHGAMRPHSLAEFQAEMQRQERAEAVGEAHRSQEFCALWNRAGDEMRASWSRLVAQMGDELHASWTRLGEDLAALVESRPRAASPQDEEE